MLNKQLIIYLCNYLHQNELDSYRQCNNYLSVLLGPLYFKDIIINAKINTKEKYKFRSFVHKYNLSLNIKKIKQYSELSFFST